MMLRLVVTALAVWSSALGCQLSSDWRHLSEGCRAELAQIILYAKVLAVHEETHSSIFSTIYNYLPWQYEAGDSTFFYSAEIELLCDQAWGSMLEVPAGSRLNITGLGYFDCHSYTVVEGHSFFFFLRMDENYNLLPHGVNFQDAIFADTQDNWRLFSSLFQYSNCSQGQQVIYELESQEDSRSNFRSNLCRNMKNCEGFVNFQAPMYNMCTESQAEEHKWGLEDIPLFYY
ncbi:coiled-coil domain-containing protein 3 isoform X2 [Ranitomeya imitator]|uniref:coiled-coil domain-containing protein 3 isoform X2 n=1 Tax=Ranitomeya imitator TaxID=111125 RepID=UPI0037E7310F